MAVGIHCDVLEIEEEVKGPVVQYVDLQPNTLFLGLCLITTNPR